MPIDKSYAPVNRMAVNAAEWDVGGKLNINSGGQIVLESGAVWLESFAEGLTAHAGGGEASALVLTALLNRVTTVATIADSVKLPPTTNYISGSSSASVTVINAAANALQMFGNGTDTINGVASGTGVSIPGGKTASFFTTLAGAWHMQLSA